MKRAYFLMLLVLVAALALPACKKKEQAPPAKTQQAAPATQQTAPSTTMTTTQANTQAASGEAIYNKSCASCHASGVAGAPKVGDAAAWKDRIAEGENTLYDHAINGFQSMPAKGGNASLTDDQVKAAVDYMVSQSK